MIHLDFIIAIEHALCLVDRRMYELKSPLGICLKTKISKQPCIHSSHKKCNNENNAMHKQERKHKKKNAKQRKQICSMILKNMQINQS